MDKKYKSINVRKEDYEILATLAIKSNRTMLGMFAHVLGDWCVDEANGVGTHAKRTPKSKET